MGRLHFLAQVFANVRIEDGLACFTLDCGGLQGITWVCWELLDNTWDYMGLRGLIGISGNYLEILGITWDY